MESNNSQMVFTLVKDSGKQRFYKSSREIIKFPRESFDWEEELKYSKTRLKEGVKILDDKCFYVVISDATTHTERLVFAGTKYMLPNGEESVGIASMLHIGGEMTMMTQGGDESSIRPDEVYLRQISILNSGNDNGK